jgi:hypothetical protein
VEGGIKMFITFISENEIAALRKEAKEKGDDDLVKICDLARKGNDAAQIFCAHMLLDAREKSLSEPISLSEDNWYIRAIKGLRNSIYLDGVERTEIREAYGDDPDYWYDENEELKDLVSDICDLALEGDEKAILVLARRLLRQQKDDLAKIERQYSLRSSERELQNAVAVTGAALNELGAEPSDG